ncbi:MAG: hypothetical protein AB7N80_03065 [Bdellovibrionales bacterium]
MEYKILGLLLLIQSSWGATVKSTPTRIVVQQQAVSGNSALNNLKSNVWYAFPNSLMSSVSPPGVNNAPVITAWNSGVYDTDNDYFVIWGGGHTDYSGNEIYRFGPITSENPKWERLTNPSSPAANNSTYGSDGRPVSRHTYDLLDYLPAPFKKMISVGVGSQYSNGFSQNAVDLYNFSVNGMTGQPWTRGALPSISGSNIFAVARYNPVTKLLWYLPGESSNNRLQSYDPDLNKWTSFNSGYGLYSYATATIDTKRNRFLLFVQGYGILVFDLNSPNTAPVRITQSGTGLGSSAQSPGFVYDPNGDRILGWNGGTGLYALSIPAAVTGTWNWSSIPLDASSTLSPGNPAGAGTYGRFRYVPSYNAVILVNSVSQSVYLRKL